MSTPTLDANALAGRVCLRPGPAQPGRATLISTRPDWVGRLSAGRPAEQLPTLLASVFALCGHAHHWTSRRAIAAAQGPDSAAVPEDVQRHRLATAREHILRISHDWPLLLPGAPPQPDAAVQLRACPAWREDWPVADRLAELPAWLAQKWLGQPVADWLAAHTQAPSTWAATWAAQTRTPLARLLHSQHAACAALATPALALDVLGPAAPLTLPLLARQMSEPGFCAQPHWQGEVPDTGPWSRHADPLRAPARSAWDRLLARLVEVLRLASEPSAAQPAAGEAWLAHGALALGERTGLAWVEMARGLLIHRVQLGEDGRVLNCQVLAPTEWNFHPEGLLARALRRLPASAPAAELDAAARRLAVAFDPCVAFDVELSHA